MTIWMQHTSDRGSDPSGQRSLAANCRLWLEADKSSPDEALNLAYSYPDGQRQRVYMPSKLYVIDALNIADRSPARGGLRVASLLRVRHAGASFQ